MGREAYPGARVIVDVDTDWKFARRDEPAAARPDFDDAAWAAVTLPHTWNNLDGQDGGDDYYRGPGWYRRHLDLRDRAAELAGRTLALRFGAASRVAQVFVNGRKVGEHRGCFAAFCLDVTRDLHLDGDNVIAVRVDNATVPDVAPLSADFTFFGGLYRDVSLLALPPVAVSPFDDGSDGVYVTQSDVSADQATLAIKVELHDAAGGPHDANVLADVLDADGHPVASVTGIEHVAIHDGEIVLPAKIDRPHLWAGRADPYLYHVRVTVDGADVVTVPLGLRSYAVSPDTGFVLNGKPYPIRGVCRHQDRRDKGWAIGPEEQAEDFGLILEMGATAVRFAHYQQAPMAYDLCDRGGLIVWSEVPVVNQITPDNPAFVANAAQQLREMVKQDFNHPSVCFWGTFNELGNGLTVAAQKAQHDQQMALITRLNAVAHQLDPGRLTTAATSRPPGDALNTITDEVAFNYYPGWYAPDMAKFPAWLDVRHAALPGRPIAISEYGAGGSIHQHAADLTKAPKTTDPFHPEEWQATVHARVYPMMQQRPWLWGTFVWNMFDFGSDGRAEGDQHGINDKGLVTYDRRTKKDAFYFYKAIWSADPFVYVADRRFTPRPVGRGPVQVYSNAATVELSVNGQSLGAKAPAQPGVFVWSDVALKPGANALRATASIAGKGVVDECTVVFEAKAATAP